jgi:hypothetical protein
MSPQGALLGVLWPMAMALAALLTGLALRRWRSAGPAAGAAAIAGAYIAAELVIRPRPPLIPADSTRWLLHIAIVLGAVAIARAVAGRTVWVLALTGVALGASTALVLRSSILPHQGAAAGTATLLTLTLIVLGLHLSGRIAARGHPMFLGPLLLLATCAGAAVALGQSFTASLGQLAGALAAALGMVMLMTAWWPRMGAASGAMPLASVLLGLILLAGRSYSQLPTFSAGLLLLATIVPALLALPGVRELRPAQRAGVGLAVIAGLAAAATGLTPMGFDFSPSGS